MALGWVSVAGLAPAAEVIAVSRGERRTTGQILTGGSAFYDPTGGRLRV